MTKKAEPPVETILTPMPETEIVEAPQPEETDQTEQQLKPILSAEDVARIKAKARTQIEKQRKEAAEKSLLEKELERLRIEEGMVTGGVGDQMVTIRIDLPEMAPYISVNWNPYWHGQTYTVPRHVANSLREQIWRAWDHERIRKGESLTDMYRQSRRTMISAVRGAQNAPQRPDA